MANGHGGARRGAGAKPGGRRRKNPIGNRPRFKAANDDVVAAIPVDGVPFRLRNREWVDRFLHERLIEIETLAREQGSAKTLLDVLFFRTGYALGTPRSEAVPPPTDLVARLKAAAARARESVEPMPDEPLALPPAPPATPAPSEAVSSPPRRDPPDESDPLDADPRYRAWRDRHGRRG